jgi:hypothetical protein
MFLKVAWISIVKLSQIILSPFISPQHGTIALSAWQMSDPLGVVLKLAQDLEAQLKTESELLNEQILQRDRETRRARALYQIFQEQRFCQDVQNGRLSQPPVFYEAWNRSIGRLEEYVKGADESVLPQMYQSFEATLSARAAAHKAALLQAIG